MSGLRKCAKCGRLFRIENEGPEAMRSDGTFPTHVCAKCDPKCADCGNSVGDAYYADVPNVGDLCIGCHVRRFRKPGNLSTFDGGGQRR